MHKSTESVNKRIDSIKKWLKNPYNLNLVVILTLALVIRLYYFLNTQGQALWWDEAEYLSASKKWAFGVPYDINPQRPPLFQFISALAFMSGLGENFIRFSFVLIPSVLLVFAIYLLGKEMYNKKVGLIAALFVSVSWTFLFWTARVQPDFFSMTFQVLAIFFMWKHWKNNNLKYVMLAGALTALGFYFKVSALLVPMSFVIFVLITERISAFKNKYNYYYSLAFLVTLIPYFIWSYVNFGTFTAFKSGYSNALGTITPFAWNTISYFYILTGGLFFILFAVGLIYSLRFLLYTDILIKDKKACLDPNLFTIINLIVISAFYIFYIRGVEDRWVFLFVPFIFYLTGEFMIVVYDNVKKYNKLISILALLTLILVLSYNQFSQADRLIRDKQSSYLPVKEAGLWIKENSQPGDKVLSISYTQTVYYTERNVSSYSEIKNSSEFDNYLKDNKPRFLEQSVFEPHPTWISDWVATNQKRIVPVKAYFADPQQKQVLMVVYEIKY